MATPLLLTRNQIFCLLAAGGVMIALLGISLLHWAEIFRFDSPTALSLPKIKRIIPFGKFAARATERRIAGYMADHDPDAGDRLRHELLDLAVPREEAIRIAKSYLNHPNPRIRYSASETLYKLGDRSGAQTLIQLVSHPSPIPITGVDSELRGWAAAILAEYRETRGADAVAALYLSTKNLDIRRYAIQLGAREVIPDLLADMKKQLWANQLEECAQLGVTEAKPLIIQQFNNENAPVSMRVSAAGAMLRFGEQEPYFSYLLDIASQFATADSLREDSSFIQAGQTALRRIGRVHGDKTRKVLELALDSKRTEAADLALVQLCVNYPESTKARERILADLRRPSGSRSNLSATTVYRLAAMSGDEEIRSAAATRNAMLWQMAALHERDWDKDAWLRGLGAK